MTITLKQLRKIKFDASATAADFDEMSYETWKERADNEFPVVKIGIGLLQFSDKELVPKLANVPIEVCDAFLGNVTELIKWTEEYIAVMKAVEARLMVAMARNIKKRQAA